MVVIRLFILSAVRLSRISPPRGGEYLHEVTAGSITPGRIPTPARTPDGRRRAGPAPSRGATS
ncbi:hypothetical protein BRD06_08140 [Halobacteriales archaeon QS_9_67_15]|nr:MAG: hypothetical protein BRD06_08140 [Halobacteriales archaeon QS_9_67_15]